MPYAAHAPADLEPPEDHRSREQCRPPEPRAAEIARAVVSEHAGAADSDRQLSPEAVTALVDAGFPRHFVPRSFGGNGGTFTDFLRDASVVAEGCAAAGWCASLFASHARMAAFLPAEGQREIWGGGPDTLIACGFIPGAKVGAEQGGWRISGSWSYISGIDFAEWVLVSGFEPPGPPGGKLRFFAVRRQDCAVEDTWFTLGLRGTGSKTAVLSNVFVPNHMSFTQQALLAGEAPASGGGGTPDRCHRVPFRLVNGLTMAAPMLGAARGAMQRWPAWIARKSEMLMGRLTPAGDKASVQAALARSTVAIETAEMLLARAGATADTGEPVAAGMLARSHRDYAMVAESLTEAIDRVVRASGSRAQADNSPVQRAWRDIHAAASHAALQFDTNAAVYAQHVLGRHQP